MSKFLWFLGGATLAVAAFVVLNQQNGTAAPADTAGDEVGAWGLKQRGTGLGGELAGKLKQGAGKLTGSEQLQNEGAFDQATGAVKDAAGQVAVAVSKTIHDLNK